MTSFLYRAYPVSTIFGGPIFWDQKDASELMKWYREFLPRAPLELCPFLHLGTIPSMNPFPKELWGRKICGIISCYNGPLDKAEDVFGPIHRELPPPILDLSGQMPFPALQSLFEPLLPKGLQWYWKGDFVRELPDKAIEIHLEYSDSAPSELSLMHLYPIDGAVHAVGKNETAFNCRDATWSMVIDGVDPDPAKADRLKEWGRSYWKALHPYNLSGAYVNFMMEEGDDRIRGTYGDNYERLAGIKKKYDPENFFRVNQNIKPA